MAILPRQRSSVSSCLNRASSAGDIGAIGGVGAGPDGSADAGRVTESKISSAKIKAALIMKPQHWQLF